MITRLKVKNYRSIEEIDLPLSPLTVLVGKNGAGKSTILDVLAFVRDALTIGVKDAVKNRGGINSVRRWTSNDQTLDVEITLYILHNTVPSAYYFTLGQTSKDRLQVKREGYTLNDPDYHMFDETIESDESGGFHIDRSNSNNLIIDDNGHEEIVTLGNSASDSLFLPVMRNLSNIKFDLETVISLLTDTEVYSIPPENIRYPQENGDDTKLWGDGGNLASVLSRLQSDEATFGRIRSALRQIIPNVEDIRVRGLDDYYSISLKHHRKGDAEAWFSLRHESDGTLRALALLTALYQDYTHSCIAIEEPETAIFSRQLGVIADALYEASLRRQVIVTTQSPDLISCFAADDLRIVTEVDGATTAGTLDKTQLRIIEKELFNAGELLRLEGLYSSSIPRGDEVVA